MNLPAWVLRIQNLWVSLGVIVMFLGAQGVNLPEQVLAIFSQTFIDTTIVAIGAVFTYIQFLRGIFITQVKAGVRILSVGALRTFAFNPFKLAV